MMTQEISLSTIAPPAKVATLGFLLREVYEALQRRVYASVAADGHPEVRDVHSPVLRHLPPQGARVADLARQSGLAKQSVAYIVQDLTRLGYVEVAQDPEDGRAKRVQFTRRGERLIASLLAHSAEAERELGAHIGATRVANLREALESAVASLAKG